MITLVRVLFWLPSVVLIAIIFYLMHWNKERLYLAVLTLPVIYFMWKVFNYNYFEPDSVFCRRIIRVGFVSINRHSLFDTFK